MKYIVLSQPNCPFCRDAVDLLEQSWLDWEVINIDDNQPMKTLLSLANLKTVPQIFKSNGRHVGGFSELKASIGNNNNE